MCPVLMDHIVYINTDMDQQSSTWMANPSHTSESEMECYFYIMEKNGDVNSIALVMLC